jgi:hypothetical protein
MNSKNGCFGRDIENDRSVFIDAHLSEPRNACERPVTVKLLYKHVSNTVRVHTCVASFNHAAYLHLTLRGKNRTPSPSDMLIS